jgi:hypothetical protein
MAYETPFHRGLRVNLIFKQSCKFGSHLKTIYIIKMLVIELVEWVEPNIIVMIESISQSFCLCYCVPNGLSYLGEETRPTRCLWMPSV